MSHTVIVLYAIRVRQLIVLPLNQDTPLILLLLHEKARALTDPVIPMLHRAPLEPPALGPPRARAAASTPPPVVPLLPEAPPPTIDWQREAESAVQNYLADADKQKYYRDLSALSPEQLGWIKRNHMQPAPPGIEWTHPRFEFDRHSGLPIFWINDHCVLVTLMVFCGIGKIEYNGGLLDHMRDPHDP
jgi:hypothetical protein